MLLGVDERGFTQRVERKGVKLENREGPTQRQRRKDEGKVRHEERERERREVGTKRKSYQYKNDRRRKKDVEMKEVHESHQKDRDKCIETQLEIKWREAEKREGYRLYQACQSYTKK